MKVLIVNAMLPFVWGGAEELAAHLKKNLVIAGHEAEILRIPFQWEPFTRIPSQMLMVRAYELSNVDHVIALKFPAYLIRHPKKTFWLLHQFRQAYDLFDTGHSHIPKNALGDNLRELIKNADNESIRESRAVYTNSEVTRQRLMKYNELDSEVLLPPVNDPHLFKGGEVGGYIFAGGRINAMKRQHLLLEALRYTSPRVKLIIAGPPDTPADGERLKKYVEDFHLHDRVKLDLRFLPRETYADYMNGSAAVAYLPYDEDSLGYVSMEAATASKALITTTDSGGILGLVKHQETGWIAQPERKALAEVMSAVFQNEKYTESCGVASRELWCSFGITWPTTVEKLLQ